MINLGVVVWVIIGGWYVVVDVVFLVVVVFD